MAVGDEVIGTADGSFAELAVVPESRVARKPATLSFEEAATLPVSGLTALQAVRDAGRISAGDRVLVIGASGGVGSYAVQIATAYGAEVTGVASGGKADLVRSLGATRVIDYTREDLDDGTRYDVVLDIAGLRPIRQLRRLLTDTGTLVIIGGEGGDRWLGGTHRQLAALALSPFVRPAAHRLAEQGERRRPRRPGPAGRPGPRATGARTHLRAARGGQGDRPRRGRTRPRQGRRHPVTQPADPIPDT